MIDKSEKQIMEKWDTTALDSPLVTICCTAFNHEYYIERALDGFLMQETTFPFEVIVHDDVSTDRTVEIIREFENRFPSIIKPVYEVENQYSKNDGSLRRIMYEKAKGKYIALCEGDDYWCDSDKIQQQAEALEEHPECTIAFCKVQFVDQTGKLLSNTTAPGTGIFRDGIITLEDLVHNEFGMGNWTFHTSSFLYRAELGAGHMQIMQEEFSVFPYGDMPLQLYCLMNGNGYYIDKIQSCYRTMSGGYNSYMEQHPEIQIIHLKNLIKGLEKFDQLTRRKYHKNVTKGICRTKFRIDVISKSWLKVLHPRYIKMGVSLQLKMFIKILFPKTYGRLVLLKRSI